MIDITKILLFASMLFIYSCSNQYEVKTERTDSVLFKNFNGLDVIDGYTYFSTINDTTKISSINVRYFSSINRFDDDSFVMMFDKVFKKGDYFRVYVDNEFYVWTNFIFCEHDIYCPFNVLNIPEKTKFIGFQFNKNRIVYFLKSELTEIVVFSLKDDELLINFYDIESFKKNKKELILQVPI